MQFADLDLTKTYTFADYYSWKFAERVELIKGKIFKMSPAPNTFHQQLVGFIYLEIGNFLRKKPCKVFVAPFDVRLPGKSKDDKEIFTVLQPDICVVCDPSKIDKKGCVGAPDLVVEVLSPGNNAKEIKNKYEQYELAGVKEYWVVSPQNQTVLIHILTDGKYDVMRLKGPGDVITSAVLPDFSLDLTEMFKDSEED